MQVLPRGKFSFDYEGKQITGRFCTWSMNRFCKKMGIANLSEMFKVLTEGISIEAVAAFLSAAVEYEFAKDKQPYPFDEMDAMEWIDLNGGLSAIVQLIVEAVSTKEAEEVTVDEEKKTVMEVL